ncbi:ribonuclease catalytic domain-containing protein [Methylophilus medardicus]|uniref:RNB domain-containing ribonuclease n=1 Tax=Methylophilus medardicus TaxID=2588534 RepID=A0A5B8CSJ0_9PROT|nr:RNB domain-containing ribonuclease [Methylophilus medardicus]QDC44281.1 RNB domain-containing ribonuclease [Methylophilus medardicus]QDC49288.1 RNB domain-containing ribonuclease [Methylophilus medardicus]QDC52993.1 RNB domain-containing ribonuclease [Methylophilus medardicus]
MNVFYEEDGGFKVASIMSEADSSMQVEATTGKRSKIKAANVLMRFDGSLSGFLDAAQAEADALDTDFLWECCGEPEFSFETLAEDYYGAKPTRQQAAAIAIKLHAAPMYFYRKGKGHYKAAPEDTLKAALAGLEKKRQQAEWLAQMVTQLKQGALPEGFSSKLDALLYAPDKNSVEWKALEQAATELKQLPVQLLHAVGAIQSIHDYHLGAFLREYFAHGTAYPDFSMAALPDDLPRAAVQAFSIDDSTTTEIDDALSVTPLDNGNTQVGIHIAAPALGIAPREALDLEVMKRLSTVYMPGHKITMLPEPAIRPFSLDAGEVKPALSLYLEVAPDFTIVRQHSCLERVQIAENLRHDTLEPFFNETTLAQDSGHPYWAALVFLFRLAESLEKARGKYDPSRPQPMDYNFYVEDGRVQIVNRQRGSPMDKLVAELMIVANSQWGLLLAEHDVPGIYRAQNGGKVYMTTKAEGHQGLGVAQYAWCTSPLRRAVDLINQRQLISVLTLQPPVYAANSDEIVGHMRNFDQTYQAYNEFQTRMERYWCLQYLLQEHINEIEATVWRENLVRLENLPYMTKVHSLPAIKPGSRVLLAIQKVDTLLMELECKFVRLIEETVPLEVDSEAAPADVAESA